MEEETPDIEDGPNALSVALTMHPDDKIVLTQIALGMKPTILITIDMPNDDLVHAKVEAYGVGTALEDVHGTSSLLQAIGMAIKEKADEAYAQVTVDDEDEEP